LDPGERDHPLCQNNVRHHEQISQSREPLDSTKEVLAAEFDPDHDTSEQAIRVPGWMNGQKLIYDKYQVQES